MIMFNIYIKLIMFCIYDFLSLQFIIHCLYNFRNCLYQDFRIYYKCLDYKFIKPKRKKIKRRHILNFKISANKFYIIYMFLLERKEKLNRNRNMYFTKGFMDRSSRCKEFKFLQKF